MFTRIVITGIMLLILLSACGPSVKTTGDANSGNQTSSAIKTDGSTGSTTQTSKSAQQNQTDNQLKTLENLLKDKKFADAEKALKELPADSPDTISGYRQLAAAYYQQKNFQKAAAYFEKTISKSGATPDTLLQLADSQYQLKNTMAAFIRYKNAYEKDAQAFKALLKMGEIYLQWGNKASAQKAFETVLAGGKENARANYGQALIFYSQKQLEKALAALGKSLAEDSKLLEARALEIQILADQKKKDKLQPKLDAFAKDYADNIDGILFLGSFYAENKDYKDMKKAAVLFEKALMADRNNQTVLHKTGWFYYLNKEYSKLMSVATMAEELNADDAVAVYYKGLVEFRNKNLKNAKEYFSNAYKMNPAVNDALLYLSYAHSMEKNKKESIDYLIDYYKSDINDFKDLFRSAEFSQIIGEAQQNFWTLYDRNNDFIKGVYLCLADSWDKALYMFVRQKDNSEAYYLAARIYFTAGNKNKGKEALMRYLADPKADKSRMASDSSFNSVKAEDWFIKAIEK